MTYCVAMALDEGLLFASDSRTNAGVDQVSTFSKMTVFETPGERVLVLLNSGNLATTQTVISTLRKAIGTDAPNLTTSASLFDCAALVGECTSRVISFHDSRQPQQSSVDFSCHFLVGGQIHGERPRLFLVYPEGNFIEATEDTPFFQIGESKYGKPIIDRVVKPQTTLAEALKCALVSFDSTMRSNLSVGLPLDVALVRRDALRVTFRHRVDAGDAYFASIRQGWSQGLRRVFNELPGPDWLPSP
jgi:putative proteasome-type protease